MKVFQSFEKMSNENLKAWMNTYLKAAGIEPGLAILWAIATLFSLATAWIRLSDPLLLIIALLPGLALANIMVCYERYRLSRCLRELSRRGLLTDFFGTASTDRLT
jgi:hypothetical protein